MTNDSHVLCVYDWMCVFKLKINVFVLNFAKYEYIV